MKAADISTARATLVVHPNQETSSKEKLSNQNRFDRNIGHKIEAKIIKVATIMLIIMMTMAGKIMLLL